MEVHLFPVFSPGSNGCALLKAWSQGRLGYGCWGCWDGGGGFLGSNGYVEPGWVRCYPPPLPRKRSTTRRKDDSSETLPGKNNSRTNVLITTDMSCSCRSVKSLTHQFFHVIFPVGFKVRILGSLVHFWQRCVTPSLRFISCTTPAHLLQAGHFPYISILAERGCQA